MKKRITALFLCLLLWAASAVPAGAVYEPPTPSQNYALHNYSRWSEPVTSYLYVNGEGGLTRVEYTQGKVVAEHYDSDFILCYGTEIEPELPVWGGFFPGEEYNFIVYGQNNDEEDDEKEVIRIVKYDKIWNRLGHASLMGANTTHPFTAGSLRFAEYEGELYIRTCHEMYTDGSDGLAHQANLTIALREEDMVITDSCYQVKNVNYGYVSHSFNQFLLVDSQGSVVCLDHGDAFPRSTVLTRYETKAGQETFSGRCETADLMEYAGEEGDNNTGATLGGFAETETGYIAAHTYDGQGGAGDRIPYLSFIDRESLAVQTRALPFEGDSAPPMLVSFGPESGYVLWNTANTGVNTGITYYYIDPDGTRTEFIPKRPHGDDTLYYAAYNADGSFGQVQTAQDAPLSDCQPIVYGENTVWYVTDEDIPVFYTLGSSGASSRTAALPDVPETGTAYASQQSVDLDGEILSLSVYAIRDPETGNPTNYVRLRDLAVLMTGTQAGFDVGWDGAVNIYPAAEYTPQGVEGQTPFSGDMPYLRYDGETRVAGRSSAFSTIWLTDSNGGGYTYYRLRDLGRALGFNVRWDSDRDIICIESDRHYTG